MTTIGKNNRSLHSRYGSRLHTHVYLFSVLTVGLASAVSAEPLSEFLTLCGGGTGALPTQWRQSGNSIHYSRTGGFVGIMTPNPAYELDVQGTVRASSIKIGDNALQSLFIEPGESNSISEEMIQSSAVSNRHIAPSAITTAKINNESVTFVKLADSAVGTAKIHEHAVTRSKIHPGAVGVEQIDAALIQKRVSGSCTAGSTVASINEDGTVNCTQSLAWMHRTFCAERTNPLNDCPAGWTQYGPRMTNPAGLSNCEEFTTVLCYQPFNP